MSELPRNPWQLKPNADMTDQHAPSIWHDFRVFELAGYRRGLREGIGIIELLTLVKPEKVTKAWMLEQLRLKAAEMRSKLEDER